jgi:hypothetical protein
MSTRFLVSLNDDEAEALARLAYAEVRDPRDQLRHILRAELKRRNLLPEEAAGEDTIQKGGTTHGK